MHRYPGERGRGAAPTGRSIGADSKTISVTRAAAGLFKWAIIGGTAYPKPTKNTYAVGESVQIDFGYKNEGGVAARATITVVDADTGATVWTYEMPSTNPGDTALASGTTVGKMPDKAVWNLRCDISP